MKNYKIVKSPLNFTGGKARLMPQILPYLPQDITRLVDVMGGSGEVIANFDGADIYCYNDTCWPLVDLLKLLYSTNLSALNDLIVECVTKNHLSKTNKEAYYKFRNKYNFNSENPIELLVLVAHSFNNYMRFNKKGEFNVPFGKRTFNEKMREKLQNFVKSFQNKNVIFRYLDFRELDFGIDGFYFFDPPYLAGDATYNIGWGEKDECDLLDLLDQLTGQNIRWALTNAASNGKRSNDLLANWCKKYKVIGLNNDYKNSNANRHKSGDTKEVLVMNY